MFTNNTYILVASGSISTPRLDIMVHATTHERAVEDSKEVVQSLSMAGYFHFHLYFVGRTTSAAAVPIASFSASKPVVEVSVKEMF